VINSGRAFLEAQHHCRNSITHHSASIIGIGVGTQLNSASSSSISVSVSVSVSVSSQRRRQRAVPRSPRNSRFGGAFRFTFVFGIRARFELVMSQIPLLLITNSDITAYPITLVRDVSLFIVEFWDTRLGDWTDEWLATNQLPKMLRVSIGIGHIEGSQSQPAEIASRVISIPSIAVTPDIQQPIVQP
jgi:hypothetical protein